MNTPCMMWVNRARLLLLFFAGWWLGGCSTAGSACDDPSDPRSCGCAIACAEGEWCMDGRCVGGSTWDNCGPTGIECALGEMCIDGRCVCDAESNSTDPTACGCPAVDCRGLQDQEMCVDGQCRCDPAYHTDNDLACGCPSVACDSGFICKDSTCQCVPEEHLTDSENCGCNGECRPGTICNAGRCVCPNGTLPCGDACVPLGYQCCDAETGDACPAGNVCELDRDGQSACRPSERRPCYDEQGRLLGTCAGDEACEMSADGLVCLRPDQVPCRDELGRLARACGRDEICVEGEASMVCHPRHLVPCYEGGVYSGACGAGERCAAGGQCIREGMKLCADDQTVCESEDVCEWDGAGYVCRPGGTIGCFEGGRFEGWCEMGDACEHSDAGPLCRPGGTVPCYHGNGLFDRFCEQGEVCEETAGGHACREQGHVPCFEAGLYVGSCAPGHQCVPGGCVPADHQHCGGMSICPPDHACERAEGGYRCRPRASVACYSNGLYTGFCEVGELCEETRGGGHACREPGSNPCYDWIGNYTGTCPAGWVCIDGGRDCMPPGGSICPDESDYCRPGFTCYSTDDGGNGCVPNGREACLELGRLVTRDGVYAHCSAGFRCDEDRYRRGESACVR